MLRQHVVLILAVFGVNDEEKATVVVLQFGQETRLVQCDL